MMATAGSANASLMQAQFKQATHARQMLSNIRTSSLQTTTTLTPDLKKLNLFDFLCQAILCTHEQKNNFDGISFPLLLRS